MNPEDFDFTEAAAEGEETVLEIHPAMALQMMSLMLLKAMDDQNLYEAIVDTVLELVTRVADKEELSHDQETELEWALMQPIIETVRRLEVLDLDDIPTDLESYRTQSAELAARFGISEG